MVGEKVDWWIEVKRLGYRRHTWAIPYMLSKFAIVGTQEYATPAAAKQAAHRAIRRLFGRGDMA